MAGLPTLIGEAMDDPATRVLILRAAEPAAFSAGADIAKFAAALIDAAEAHRIGLVDFLDDDAGALTETIAANSARTAREAKAMVRRILNGQAEDDATTRALFADAFTSADFDQGARAF